jgi:hypothetical protein
LDVEFYGVVKYVHAEDSGSEVLRNAAFASSTR